ncbi:MAG TPA: hypothetical protein VGJ59_19830 [Jatrophihabitantaceae bacterium]|jgi:hypothetical protein
MHRFRFQVILVAAALTLFAVVGPAALAAPGPAVSGGGVVSGPLGTTSQLGITASDAGGHLLCVMAGRSGGFPFGPWQAIQQMNVSGPVTPGTLQVTGDVSSFAGVATIHVVGTTATGAELITTLTGVPFVSSQRAGGAGVAWHELDVSLPGGAVSFGPEVMASGHINVSG